MSFTAASRQGATLVRIPGLRRAP